MGMFSAAIGAGAGAAADQATGLINSETKVNAEKELMAAREQMEMRLREAQEQTRRSGNAYDFEQAGKNQPEVLKREDVAGRAKGARDTELKLGAQAAEAQQGRAESLTTAQFTKDHPILGEQEREHAANKEPPGQADLRSAQANYYRAGGAAGARAAAGGGKDDEKTAQNLANGYLKTAKALEDGGAAGAREAAQVLREKAQATLDGIGERQTDKGKGAAAKSYPPVPEAHSDKFNLRLTEAKRKFPDVKGKPSPGFEREKALIISAFEKTYGPGSTDALIE